jgi:hypothetical protein
MQWIQTVIGIAEFCRSSSPKAFHELLSVVQLETWERRGDGLDDAREQKYGPILAEGEFTVIQLLAAIELWGPAKFYEKRGLYTHDKITDARDRINPTNMWEYEDEPKDTSSLQFKEDQKLRELWDALYSATRAQQMCTTVMPTHWTFDPMDRLWPRHDPYIDDMTKNTDANKKTDQSTDPWNAGESWSDPPTDESNDSGGSNPSGGSDPSTKSSSGSSAKSKPPPEGPYDYGAYPSGPDLELGAPNNPALKKGNDNDKE